MNNLFKMLDRDTDLFTPHFLRLVCLSGLANAAVLAVVNMAVQSTSHGKAGLLRGLVLFCLAIGIYVVSQKKLMVDTCERVEDLIVKLRWRLLEAVRNSECHDVDRIGRSEIFGSLSRETHVLSQATPNLIVAVQSAVLLIASMTYMFFLSKTAFFLLAICTTAGALFHLSRGKVASAHIREASRNDDALIEGFSDLIDGFREVKLNRARATELSTAIQQVSRRSRNSRVTVHSLNARDFVLSQLTFFCLIGLMVFVVPAFGSADTKTITMTTTATLFMLGPVGALVGNFPVFNTANEAAKRIQELEARLQGTSEPHASGEQLDTFAGHQLIELQDLAYSYPAPQGEKSFDVGPISMTIRRGECIFITGGNGSGKTTFISLLLTLLPADSGSIAIDGQVVKQTDLTAYRNLFAVIFSDNHLFQTLYGTEPFTAAEADALLAQMEIGHKVAIEQRRFTTTDLSGGQRKRLALVTAQLERKPILVLDEWAADQDPVFREKFYSQVIPALRERGCTILAITHDDRYFHLADARYHMADGLLTRLD